MGSFDVGCFVSDLPINEGDECGFIPLGKPRFAHDRLPNCYWLLQPEFYAPVFLPILGIYADYGNFEIDKSNNIRF